MQFIYLDIGNSNIKAAIKNDLLWERIFECRSDENRQLEYWLRSLENKYHLVLSSVVPAVTNLIYSDYDREKLTIITQNHIPSYLMDYSTPKTMGVDRYLACYGAVSLTGNPVVVIDAGTACTVDYMSSDYIYRGGVIMPGLTSIAMSVQQFLPMLPVVDDYIPKSWPGNSTETSLQWGTVGFFIEGVHGFLNRYREKFGNYQLFITGGDGLFLSRHLNPDYNGRFRMDLIFEGISRFYENYF